MSSTRAPLTWATRDRKTRKLQDMHGLLKGAEGYKGCILDTVRHVVGVRYAKGATTKSEFCQAMGALDLASDGKRCKLQGIPMHWATKGEQTELVKGELPIHFCW